MHFRLHLLRHRHILQALPFCLSIIFLLHAGPCSSSSEVMSLRLLHRFSDEARDFLSRKYGSELDYDHGQDGLLSSLLRLDQARNDRVAYQSVHFDAGNRTVSYGSQFAWLHFAVLDIGTPKVSFLVVLDTGSNMLWVPCECKQCALTSHLEHELGQKLKAYNPAFSNSSKRVTCSNEFCNLRSNCKTQTADCPYNIRYLSSNTASSGILVEDVIYFASGNHGTRTITMKTPIVFGCGQLQSGGFLEGAAPDGLLGLGLSDISMPNFLARAGIVRKSFSLCFHEDSSGRIIFGDQGTTHDQQMTPLLMLNQSNFHFKVAVEHIAIGSTVVENSSFEVLVDSGTSFTYLPPGIYGAVATKFDQEMKESRINLTGIPFPFCYEASHMQDDMEIPLISIVFGGGGNFTVNSPLIGLRNSETDKTPAVFCLAILEGGTPILGQNFMIGYQLVYNSEDGVLGWSQSDCYKLEEPSSEVAPSPEASAPMAPTPIHHVSPSSSVPFPRISYPPTAQQNTAILANPFNICPSLVSFTFLLLMILRVFIP